MNEAGHALPLSGCTYGWLHQEPLEHALRDLAEHGIRTLELTTAPPHVFTPALSSTERAAIRKGLRDFDLQAVSVNPTFCDINLVSTNPEFQSLSERQMLAEVEFAHDLEAPFVVSIPGRLHALAPAPDDVCRRVLIVSLHRLADRGRELGVTVCLENSPYGYLGSSTDLIEIVDEVNSPHLAITYDVANAIAIESPPEALRQVGDRLALAHVSDTWRDRWAHTSPGRGEVDFAEFADSLAEIGFEGPTVYELIDMEPPLPRLDDDIATLSDAGWSPHVLPRTTRENPR